jgi:hypothetical protein
VRETPLEIGSATARYLFVLGGSTLLLRTLGGRQVTEPGRAAHQLAGCRQFEALSDGFLGLLHKESGRKQSAALPFARGFLATP